MPIDWIAPICTAAAFAAGLVLGLVAAQLASSTRDYGKHSQASAPLPVTAAIAAATEPPPPAEPPEPADKDEQQYCVPYLSLRDEIYCPTWDDPPSVANLAARRALLARVISGLRAPDWPTQPLPQPVVSR